MARSRIYSSKKNNLFLEIIRFGIVGVLATVVDFLTQLVFLRVAGTIWGDEVIKNLEYVFTIVGYTIGFLLSTIVNFILSRVFVFKDVDKNADTKSVKSFALFTGLSAVGFFLGLGIQELGIFIIQTINPSINIGYDITKISWADLFTTGGLAFWLFALVFAIKTLIVLIWNYISRKKWIFKPTAK